MARTLQRLDAQLQGGTTTSRTVALSRAHICNLQDEIKPDPEFGQDALHAFHGFNRVAGPARIESKIRNEKGAEELNLDAFLKVVAGARYANYMQIEIEPFPLVA